MNSITTQLMDAQTTTASNQQSVPNDPQAVTSVNDFFSQLIAEFFKEMAPQAVAADAKSDVALKDNTQNAANSTQNQEVTSQEMAEELAQIAAVLMPVHPATQPNADITQAQNNQTVSTAQQTVLSQIAKMLQKQEATQNQTVVKQVMNEQEMLNTAQLPEQMIKALNELKLQASQQANLISAEKPSEAVAASLTQQVELEQTNQPNLAVNLTNNLLPALNPFKTQLVQMTQMASLPKTQFNSLAIEKNKYSDALLQMGQFINSQTTQTFASEQSIVNQATAIAPAQASYADAFHKALQPDFGLQVEIQAANVNSATHETYSANIKLYPPELGAMLAKLKVGKNGTELQIVTENDRVKEVVEANLVQLRQEFQKADINLTNIQVDVQTPSSDNREQHSQHQNQTALSNVSEEATAKPQPTARVIKADSLVDTYA